MVRSKTWAFNCALFSFGKWCGVVCGVCVCVSSRSIIVHETLSLPRCYHYPYISIGILWSGCLCRCSRMRIGKCVVSNIWYPFHIFFGIDLLSSAKPKKNPSNHQTNVKLPPQENPRNPKDWCNCTSILVLMVPPTVPDGVVCALNPGPDSPWSLKIPLHSSQG